MSTNKRKKLHRSNRVFRVSDFPMDFLKAKPASKPSDSAANINHIVVHSTGTKPTTLLADLDDLPYHFLITKGGRLIHLKQVQPTDGTIEIALVGGLNKDGDRVDCRTPQQNETLFNALVELTEKHRQAKLVGADKLYVYSYANPGFDLQQWIASYIPEFLRAVA